MSEKSNAMTADELSELDELLALVDESAEPMDCVGSRRFYDRMIQLLPTLPDTRSWLGRILSTNGKASASTGSASEDKRLRELLIKRFREIGETLANSQPLDPIYFDAEDGARQSFGRKGSD